MKYFRVLLSLMLAVTVTSLFTLHVYAGDEPKAASNQSKAVQSQVIANELTGVVDCTGTLIIKSGKVMLNGNEAQNGATVVNGSIVATGDHGRVIIDLGVFGRIELGHHTTIMVNCSTGTIQGRTDCGGKVRIETHLGQVDVTVPKVETILAGKDKTYDDPVEFTAPGGSSIEIDCGKHIAGWYWGGGLLGLLALIGVITKVGPGGDTPTTTRPPVSGA